jgi:hypothetical protein
VGAAGAGPPITPHSCQGCAPACSAHLVCTYCLALASGSCAPASLSCVCQRSQQAPAQRPMGLVCVARMRTRRCASKLRLSPASALPCAAQMSPSRLKLAAWEHGLVPRPALLGLSPMRAAQGPSTPQAPCRHWQLLWLQEGWKVRHTCAWLHRAVVQWAYTFGACNPGHCAVGEAHATKG